MSYRSRLYNHRNAQTPAGGKKKPFFSSKHGAGASDDKKKFFHAGGGGTPQVQRLATSPIDEAVGTTEEKQARNKGDKLRDKPTGVGAGVIQRDLAIAPANPNAVDTTLTPQQIRNAIIFNNDRFGKDSVSLIQNTVGGPVTGVMDEETVRLIAHYQAQNNLKADGMAGPNTFGQLTDELAAEGTSSDTCLTSFNVGVVTPMQLHPGAGANQVNIFGHFDVDILFDPHCDCSRFQYRQFIGGDVTLNGRNINNQFSVPGGGLPGLGNFVEDGNTTLAGNGRFGHRNLPPNQQATNEYTDADGTQNMAGGCRFHSFDEPGVTDAPGNPGDTYVFDFRFFGDIIRDGKMVERKFWSVRETVIIP
jgi:hypothetical protein